MVYTLNQLNQGMPNEPSALAAKSESNVPESQVKDKVETASQAKSENEPPPVLPEIKTQQDLEQLISKVPMLGELLDSLKQQIHKVRLKNMQLRENHSKVQSKLTALTKTNGELLEKIEGLEKKAGSDCETILKQVKELENLTSSHK